MNEEDDPLDCLEVRPAVDYFCSFNYSDSLIEPVSLQALQANDCLVQLLQLFLTTARSARWSTASLRQRQ